MKDRTIRGVLEGFQKVELEDLGDLLGGPIRSRMRKDEMVDILAEYISANPQRWLENLQERDIHLLRQLVHAGPDNVQLLEYADYPSILEISGLVDFDDSDSQYHKVWLRREVYDIVAPHVDKAISSGEKSGRFRLERIGLGFLNLFGVLPTDFFLDLLMDYYDEEYCSDYKSLVKILQSSPLVKTNRFTDQWGDYMCSPLVVEAADIFKLRNELMPLGNYANFSYADALDAGSGAPFFTVGLKSPEGAALVKILRRIGFEGMELVQTEYDFWMEAQLPRGENSIFNIVDMEEYRRHEPHTYDLYMKAVRDYANSIPRWALYGHSASECGLLEVEIPKPYSAGVEGLSAFMPKGFPLGLIVPHVNPYDPCPCGSGLSYCHCHGKITN